MDILHPESMPTVYEHDQGMSSDTSPTTDVGNYHTAKQSKEPFYPGHNPPYCCLQPVSSRVSGTTPEGTGRHEGPETAKQNRLRRYLTVLDGTGRPNVHLTNRLRPSSDRRICSACPYASSPDQTVPDIALHFLPSAGEVPRAQDRCHPWWGIEPILTPRKGHALPCFQQLL